MQVRYASEPAPDRPINEDHAFHSGHLVGVLDGVTAPVGIDTGCVHGPAWYARRLAGHVQRTAAALAVPLTEALADAIRAVREDHGGTCDLDNPQTPAASVSLVRDAGDHADYLLLCDTNLILDCAAGLRVVSDPRFEASVAEIRRLVLTGTSAFETADHAERTRQAARLRQEHTNRPDGYWIAASLPEAAYEALTGTIAYAGPGRLRRAALLTDGASRAVEQFHLFDWRGLLDVLTTSGPEELIRRVRSAENADPAGEQQPRYKRHDDATAALCEFMIGSEDDRA